MISIKQVRKAEHLIGNIYAGYITVVQSYGFFVEILDINLTKLSAAFMFTPLFRYVNLFFFHCKEMLFYDLLHKI